jgi:hypothetical protein
MVKDLGLHIVHTPNVEHRGSAFGLVLQGSSHTNWKIV